MKKKHMVIYVLFVLMIFSACQKKETFIGTVLENRKNSILVEIIESDNLKGSQIVIPTEGVQETFTVGEKIQVTFNGIVMESYPLQMEKPDKIIKVE